MARPASTTETLHQIASERSSARFLGTLELCAASAQIHKFPSLSTVLECGVTEECGSGGASGGAIESSPDLADVEFLDHGVSEERCSGGAPGGAVESSPDVADVYFLEHRVAIARDEFFNVDGPRVSCTPGWRKRPRNPNVPEERPVCAGRVSALESALRGFTERETDVVVNPTVGTTFDSLAEAYEFYNLYSWEYGFGIRYGRSRQNVSGVKCMQEIVCGCAGKPERENSSSIRTKCPAMLRLLRSEDGGWYICEHRLSHNHGMLRTCAEKLHWPSYRHIDKYTRDLVKQRRENNVNQQSFSKRLDSSVISFSKKASTVLSL